MPKPLIEPRYVSVREAARRAGVSRSRIYELLKSGEIHAKKDGSRTLVLVASIDAWLNRLKPWRESVGSLLPPEDRALAKKRAGEPDFARLFNEHLQRLAPSVGEAEARTKATANIVRAYRRHHECDFKTARVAVAALIGSAALAGVPEIESPLPAGEPDPPAPADQPPSIELASELVAHYFERRRLLSADNDPSEAEARAFEFVVRRYCAQTGCGLEDGKAAVRDAIAKAKEPV